MKNYLALGVLSLVLFVSCGHNGSDGPREFYGTIHYKVVLGGGLDSLRSQMVRQSLGDSFTVDFTEKGYRLKQYGTDNLTVWYDNSGGSLLYLFNDMDTLYADTATEQTALTESGPMDNRMEILGRNCRSYYMRDATSHTQLWYDSTLYVSPKRFSRLLDGHYYQYYHDCTAPYLLRSSLIGTMVIRFEAMQVDVREEPDPEWDRHPDYPVRALKEE